MCSKDDLNVAAVATFLGCAACHEHVATHCMTRVMGFHGQTEVFEHRLWLCRGCLERLQRLMSAATQAAADEDRLREVSEEIEGCVRCSQCGQRLEAVE